MPIYKIKRIIYLENALLNKELLFKDGSNIIYVNGSNTNSRTALGRLMHDFWCTDPEEMYYSVLQDRVRQLKTNEQEVDNMCRSLELMREETAQAAVKKEKLYRIQNMLSRGKTPEEIHSFCDYPKELILEAQNAMGQMA